MKSKIIIMYAQQPRIFDKRDRRKSKFREIGRFFYNKKMMTCITRGKKWVLLVSKWVIFSKTLKKPSISLDRPSLSTDSLSSSHPTKSSGSSLRSPVTDRPPLVSADRPPHQTPTLPKTDQKPTSIPTKTDQKPILKPTPTTKTD